MPIGALLKEIEDKTGIQFVISEEESKTIFSGIFKSLPLEEAFNRIFQNINYVIIYNPDGKILMVRTVNKGVTPSAKSDTGIKKLQREDKITAPQGADDMNVTNDADTMDVF